MCFSIFPVHMVSGVVETLSPGIYFIRIDSCMTTYTSNTFLSVTMMHKMATCLFLAAMAGVVGGCSGGGPSLPKMGSFFGGSKAVIDAEAKPAESLYREADAYMTARKYEKAAKKFEEVDRQHPYSPLARKAIIMAAYAHFKGPDYPAAISGAKRYATLHPGTKESALAQYIISSSYFDQIKDPKHDQTSTKKALKELKVLVRRYPDSRYAAQAKNRIKIAFDVLAAKEMEVGRYYQKRHNHLAAINRFKVVVREYQQTKHVEEALMRLSESYMALGVANEAQNAAAILGHNFPNSPWYRDSYALLQSGGLAPRNSGSSWLSKTWKTVKTAVNPF